MCMFAHTPVEGEEIGEGEEKREKGRLFGTVLDNCVSAAGLSGLSQNLV